MSANTKNRKHEARPLRIRGFITGAVSTAAGSAVAQMVQSRIRTIQGQAKLPQTIEQAKGRARQERNRHSSNRRPRVAPIAEWPNLAFGKGNTALMLEAITQLEANSPAAAVALAAFGAEQRSDYQAYFQAELIRLLSVVYPSHSAIERVRQGRRTAQQLGDGLLTNKLSGCELDFLGLIHRTPRSQGLSLRELTTNLAEVADAFGNRNDMRRQASARTILAYVFFRQGFQSPAELEMSKALVLMGMLYDKSELLKLSQTVSGEDIIEQTYQSASNDEIRQRAHRLAES